ncbi:putative carboxylesterase [Phyllosticta capitalensis]|uniref:Alpha/Beta hydrolase protein n=1 Tax=Phyllosticta capitalensis TaxID=121624 RepID=UPI00312CF587
MLRFLLLFLLFFLSTSTTTHAFSDPLVTLSYGRFQGKYNVTYNITHFRKIPFGASTAGTNRFRAPQPPLPLPQDAIYDTDQDFSNCPQPPANGSEDCLYLGLYSRPWDGTTKRPVVLVFYGGGFIQGGASFTLPPPAYPILNESTSNDFVVVYSNYRVNSFGFLPGKAVKEAKDADLNVGLLDQLAALRWVKRWIGLFGGDSARVTVWGSSAGGGSVVAQVLAQAGREEDLQTNPTLLFHHALASSPFWPKTYAYNDAEAELLYSQLVDLSGCASSANTLACLKAADLQLLRNASKTISDLNKNTTSSFNWAPVIDGEVLRGPLSGLVPGALALAGLAAWAMYNTHEGESFVPAYLSNDTQNAQPNDPVLREWLRGYLPRFDEAQLAEVEELYPLSLVDGGTEAETAGQELDDLDTLNSTRARAGRVYRDSVLTCPGFWMAQAAVAKDGEEGDREDKALVGEYAIPPAKHSNDVVYWNRINAVQLAAPFTYHGFAGAFGRFFMTGDPNLDPSSPFPAAQDRKPYTSVDGKPYVPVPPLRDGKEWVIKSDAFETRSVQRLRERCDFWRANAGSVPV